MQRVKVATTSPRPSSVRRHAFPWEYSVTPHRRPFEERVCRTCINWVCRARELGFAGWLSCVLLLCSAASVPAATVPPGFVETLVASGIVSPSAMDIAPDGRIFVCEHTGQVRVIKEGVLLPEPFVSLPVDSYGERGLLGIALDPDFSTNQYVYVYYTATTPTLHNRVSRFTANGDVAEPDSEEVIFELDDIDDATHHFAGALHFGPDGNLYVAVGEYGDGFNAQSLDNLKGKLLRINSDGTIPPDNPFYDVTFGNNAAIWALGLRNPFSFAFQPGSGLLFINDVGQNDWEEINEGVAGANYGWPETEGYTDDPRFLSPRYAYDHETGCAIVGAAFYDPESVQFPSEYIGQYFFADLCGGWIGTLDPVGGGVQGFASEISFPVDLKVGADGSLYYLARGEELDSGVLYRVEYGDRAPVITRHPANQVVPIGEAASFTVEASGTPPLRYQWQRDGANIPDAIFPSYTSEPVQLSDDGALFRVMVSNDLGTALSTDALLTVTTSARPTATIVQPVEGTTYAGGHVITYSGTGIDPEDGVLPPSAFTWQVDFHHENHTHPFIPPTSGATSGSFTIPTRGETSADVWYRIYLWVFDSAGLTHAAARDVTPLTSTMTLATTPPGLRVTLDGQPVTTPAPVVGVVGITRTLGVISPQVVNGTTYVFDYWSDGGSAIHEIATPPTDTTYTAAYREGASTITLSFDGLLQDRVGPDDLALDPDGALDGTLTVTLPPGSGPKTITSLELLISDGGWDTEPEGFFYWALGAASAPDSPLLNNPDSTLNFEVGEGDSFVVFASDYVDPDYPNGLFAPGTTLTLTATFADGTTATATTTVPGLITLDFDGLLRDRVGQDDLALDPDGALDGTLTVTLLPGGGAKTITSLVLVVSDGGWDTEPGGGSTGWALGVASSLDAPLLNSADSSVSFEVAEGGSFVVFAADYVDPDYPNGLFAPGTTLTLTATFADGTTATAITTVPA